MFAVYGDADAMRWVGDGGPITQEGCAKWLEVTANNYRVRGYGMFALLDRRTGEVVGFCGLVHPGGQVDAEIKYALKRSYWGAGLATEAASAMLAYGATKHNLAEIIATTAPENAASHRVLLKAGMRRAELRDNGDGTLTQVFRWQANLPANAP
jgi:RimJ/RimL family protein N-acetyltransferase